jgi:hypothetical protein
MGGHQAIAPVSCSFSVPSVDNYPQGVTQFIAEPHRDNCLVGFELGALSDGISNELRDGNHRKK